MFPFPICFLPFRYTNSCLWHRVVGVCKDLRGRLNIKGFCLSIFPQRRRQKFSPLNNICVVKAVRQAHAMPPQSYELSIPALLLVLFVVFVLVVLIVTIVVKIIKWIVNGALRIVNGPERGSPEKAVHHSANKPQSLKKE